MVTTTSRHSDECGRVYRCMRGSPPATTNEKVPPSGLPDRQAKTPAVRSGFRREQIEASRGVMARTMGDVYSVVRVGIAVLTAADVDTA
jgi:hypothetical protein